MLVKGPFKVSPASKLLNLLLISLVVSMNWLNTLQAEQENASIGGAGIGLKQDEDGRVLIDRVAPDSPASKAGLKEGDWLIGVDGRPVAELNGSQLVDMIRGPVGSKVVLMYVRGRELPATVTLTREALGKLANKTPVENSPPTNATKKASANGSASPPARGTMKFTQQTIRDPAAQNRPALTYLLPEGWQAQGEIVWLHQYSVLANLRLRLWDANSSTSIEWLPTHHFSYTDRLPGLMSPGANWMGALFIPPVTDPAQFVQGFWAPQVLTHLQNLRPTAREDLPGVAQQAIARNPGWQAQAVRLRYEFERQGKAWEQDVYFTLAYAPVVEGVAMWNVQRAYTTLAPKGGLDSKLNLIKAVIANANFTSEWLATYTVVQQLRQQGLQQQMADTAAFGRQLQAYNAHIQQLGQQMHEERMKSFDRIAASQREYLGGVETYTDPYQRLGVFMPAGYKEHWVNQKGEVILSEVSGYNPNHGSTDEWRKMERRDPTQ